jgi:hypothetical protein
VGFYETLAREAAAAGRITPLLEAPRGVEVTSRETPDTTDINYPAILILAFAAWPFSLRRSAAA